MTGRRGLARAACALVVLASSTIAARPAAAAQDGPCPGPDGVTVVVDATDLGGGVVVRCAGVLPDGANGFDALEAAGFTVAQPIRQPGFVCRIDGRPGVGAEACVDTPPTSAYWSYWTASRGGAWLYSSQGAATRPVARGGVEGWAFAKERTANAVPPPRVAPSQLVVATTVPDRPRPTAPTVDAPSPTAPAGPPRVAGAGTVPGVDPATAPTTAVASPGETTTTAAPAIAPDAAAPPTTAASTRDSPTTTAEPRGTESVAVGAAGVGSGDTGSGAGPATAAAVVLVAALAAAAVTTSRRRAASQRADDGG